jgi:hypothetical protein
VNFDRLRLEGLDEGRCDGEQLRRGRFDCELRVVTMYGGYAKRGRGPCGLRRAGLQPMLGAKAISRWQNHEQAIVAL